MPEIRSVSVRLDADVASYIAKMKAAGRATDDAFSSSSRHISETNTSLKGTETELGKVDTAARKVDTSMSRVGTTMDRTSRSQDRFTGGTRILINSLLAVGPAAIPIAAVAIPAVAGLSGELLAAGVALGVTDLAFHGLGKTLTAFDKASLEPTTANIAAAQLALDKLPPSAQLLVLQLHSMEPVLDRLRQSAASGLAPGVTSGLQALATDAPVVSRAVHGVASELGNLASEAGRSLSGPQWRGFIRTVGQQAPVALDHLGHATGSAAHGLAALYLAFGPSLGSFDRGVENVADDFDRWATSLGRTKGFQDFLAYLSLNGPRVIGLLGDTAQLLADIVKAAAPLGGPTLQALDLVAKVLDEIAKSPLGTPLLLLLQLNAVMRLTNNALATMGASSKIGFGGITAGAAKSEGVLAGLRAEAAATAATLRTVGSNVGANIGLRGPGGLGTPLTSGVASGQLGNLAKGGAAAAGIAFLTTGAADKLGIANTATLALAGSLAGPLGAGAGAAVGALIDVSKATDNLSASTKQAQTEVKGWDLSQETASLAGLNTELDATLRKQSFKPGSGGFNPLQGFESYATRINNLFTHSISAAQLAQQVVSTQIGQQKTALALIYQGLSKTPLTHDLSNSQLQATLTRIQPAMQALGVTTDDLAASAAKGGPAFDALVASLVRYVNRADSTKGQTQAVADAFTEMSNDALTVDQRVQALTGSLDALVDPMLTLGGATDTFQQDLNDLGKNLSKNSRSLVGNSDAVIQNRNVIRGAIGDLKSKIEAEANAGASSQRMSATLRQGVGALIAQGRAAGLNAGQIQHMIDTMHLTPKLIRTLFQAETKEALTGIAAVDRAIAGIDRVVNVHVNVTRNTNALLADVNTPKNHADGGMVLGPRDPYGDKVLTYLAPGEQVISNRYGQADQFRADVADGLIPGYAGGGTVGRDPVDPHKNVPLFTGEGPKWYRRAYQHGRPFAKDGPAGWDWPYQTGLDNEKQAREFERWVNRKNVPFDTGAKHVDYDMRGYWKKTRGAGWHHGSHFPDTFKTPYDTTFSAESKYATKNNPFHWHGRRLVDGRNSQLIYRSADGGTVPGGRSVRSSGSTALGGAARDATNALHGLKVESASLTKQLEAERAERQKIAQQRATLVSSVRDQYRPQLFGATADGSSVWDVGGGLMDPLAIENKAIRQSRAYTAGIARLRRRGLTGGALAQVQTPEQLAQALALSSHEDRLISARFEVEQRASRAAGREAGDFRFGKHLASIDAEVQKLAGELHHAHGQEKTRERARAAAAKHNAAETGKAAAAGVNGAIGNGVRRQKPW